MVHVIDDNCKQDYYVLRKWEFADSNVFSTLKEARTYPAPIV